MHDIVIIRPTQVRIHIGLSALPAALEELRRAEGLAPHEVEAGGATGAN